MNYPKVPIGVSNRHIHLCQDDLEKLFGKNYTLTNIKDLVQTGEFAADETVTIQGEKGKIENVRILGPLRNATQIEISRTDSFKLGVNAPVKQSGQVEGTPGCKIIGPHGEVDIKEGVLIADRHIHLPPTEAEAFGVKDGDRVSVHIEGVRELTFHNVLVRVRPGFVPEFHIDMDEANACLVRNNDMVSVLTQVSTLKDLLK